ncbi:MAG: acyltransferase family protein, partial [Janthinobacterium lividum]
MPTLTGLRWFAALAVFGYHSVVLLGGTAESGMRTLFDHGRVGVSFFFVLSGFIVTWAWRQDDGAWPFLRRRLARIYPAYLVALIAAVVLLKLTATDQSPKALLADLFLVQSWVPQRSVFFSGNDVGWSLSCEAFFYAAFPLLLVGLRRLTNTARRVLQVAIVTGIVIIAVWAAVFMPDDYFGVGGPAVFVAYIFPPVRALEFVLGMTIALDVRAGRRAPLRWRAAVMLTVVALAVNR